MANLPYAADQVGKRLKHVRTAHGLSQHAFADRAGISGSALGNWELGQSRPSFEYAQAIADTYGLTLDFIFLGRTDALQHSVFMYLKESGAITETEPET